MCKVSQSLRAGEMLDSLYSPLGCVTAWLCICRTGGYASVKASLPTNPVALETPALSGLLSWFSDINISGSETGEARQGPQDHGGILRGSPLDLVVGMMGWGSGICRQRCSGLPADVRLTPLEFGNLQKMDGPTEQCHDPLPVPQKNCSTKSVSLKRNGWEGWGGGLWDPR